MFLTLLSACYHSNYISEREEELPLCALHLNDFQDENTFHIHHSLKKRPFLLSIVQLLHI